MSDSVFNENRLRDLIRAVPDWPEPGVMFRDISTLLLSPSGMQMVHEHFAERYQDKGLTHIGALDARGFLLGAPLANTLGLPLVIFRKPGKLPADTIREEYTLEYGTAALEVHTDALNEGDKVVLIDDLIATGGTLLAATKLIRRLNASVVEAAAIIDLPALGGSSKLDNEGIKSFTLTSY
ncbi:adenine phosphoribosyltransferase [Sansalvadorimonas sp. 2012CJ34-2]|uniref:Adenine phosphoribosyltransferase n=1 Tax=Parendozoicomonas callyspongiae TaxID=2942213 RepID=A0ABT0PLD8_9GAMM|nr:adenine phosphoribosyltransferase [Sansalvadorimonas sp. 2012CJ34-2]MCL6272190.1 adenine phosphoribosyltransferase [Sansalvadorimonas sp. 2012CJ34-2]